MTVLRYINVNTPIFIIAIACLGKQEKAFKIKSLKDIKFFALHRLRLRKGNFIRWVGTSQLWAHLVSE